MLVNFVGKYRDMVHLLPHLTFFFFVLGFYVFNLCFFIPTKPNSPTSTVIHCIIFGFSARWHKFVSSTQANVGAIGSMVCEQFLVVEMQVGAALAMVKHVDLQLCWWRYASSLVVHGALSTHNLRLGVDARATGVC